MQRHRSLSTLLTAAVLVGTPLAASAEPKPIAAQSVATPTPKAAVADDAELYAQREQQSPAAAKFEGGGESIYIGGSVLTVVLILLLIVVVL
jgi:ABC-type taurine transport system substrate-binding protein